MFIPPKYFLTQKISKLLSQIEAAKAVIESVTIPHEVEINIRRLSTLRSSLFSARIEGNPLTPDNIGEKSSKDQKKIEVFNILKALNILAKRSGKDITIKDILQLHSVVMDCLSHEKGIFRKEVSAIFNASGIAVYMPPPPGMVPKHIVHLLKFVNSTQEQFIPVRAGLTHYMFEKIHPFLDGNGRVGRLLMQEVLYKHGYGMKGLLTIEEYIDEHRSIYYRMLENTEKYVTDYIEFMLEAIAYTSEQAKQLVLEKKDGGQKDCLLPRRAEILNIIKDHRIISFDQIHRRFLAVNERTLRYDLKKLKDSGLIRKRGNTKGVRYEIKE
jgi:Fic family protein